MAFDALDLSDGGQVAKELRRLRADAAARATEPVTPPSEQGRRRLRFERLARIPALVGAALDAWVEPMEGLSDKQTYHQLMRRMGIVEPIEPWLMRTMVEAVKQHRLGRPRGEAEVAAPDATLPKGLHLRPALGDSGWASMRRVGDMINYGGDGNDFALLLAAVLTAIGARARLSIGCAAGVGAPPSCQAFAEVRLGKRPQLLTSWLRNVVPGANRGRKVHYRLDAEGHVWLNLDYADGQSQTRPGMPYKEGFGSVTTYDLESASWEVVDGAGTAVNMTSASVEL